MVVLEVLLTLLFVLFWLAALAGHAVLFKVLQTPADRGRLGFPQGHLTLVWLLLLSITLADLLALLLAVPFSSLFAIWKHWPFGLPACKLSPYLKIASVTVTSYSILGLLVICYEMVVKTGRQPSSPLKNYLLVGSIWTLALLTAVPMFISHYLKTERNYFFTLDEGTLYVPEEFVDAMITSKNNQSGATATTFQERQRQILEKNNGTLHEQTFCTTTWRVERDLGNFYLLIQFIIPVIITVFLYIKVADAMNASKQTAKNTAENNNNNPPEVAPQMPDNDVKFVRMVLIISLVFHLLWAPNNINNFFLFLDTHLPLVWIAFALLSQSTHFILPFLYLAINTNFQAALKGAFKKTSSDGTANNGSTQVGFSKMEEEAVSEEVF